MDNKKDQHRRSVETLGLSGDGDNPIIPEIYDFCIENDTMLDHDYAVELSKNAVPLKVEK